MNPDANQSKHVNDMEPWMQNSRLVRQLLRSREEIRIHKWCESEKAGHDIGWDRAVVDWNLHRGHRPSDPE